MNQIRELACKFPKFTSFLIALLILSSIIQTLYGGIGILGGVQYFLGLLLMMFSLKFGVLLLMSKLKIKLITPDETTEVVLFSLCCVSFLFSCVLLFPLLLKL